MAPITETQDKSLEILKKWASQPWEINYERIPGLAALQFNTMMCVQQLIVKFCQDSNIAHASFLLWMWWRVAGYGPHP